MLQIATSSHVSWNFHCISPHCQSYRTYSKRSYKLSVKRIFAAADLQEKQLQLEDQQSIDDKSCDNKELNVKIKKCTEISQLVQVLQENYDHIDSINVATATTRVFRFIPQNRKVLPTKIQKIQFEKFFNMLDGLVITHVDDMSPWTVSNCMSSLAKFVNNIRENAIQEYKLDKIFAKLCDRAVLVCEGMNSLDVSNTLWAMARFNWQNQAQIKKLVNVSVQITQCQFQPQIIRNILWAMSVFQQLYNVEATKHFVKLAQLCLNEMKGQEISSIVASLLSLRYYDEEFLEQVEDFCICQHEKLNLIDVSVLAFALTDFGVKNKKLLIKIFLKRFSLQDDDDIFCSPRNFSNFVCALALFGCPIQITQYLFDEKTNDWFQNFKLQDLSQIREAQLCYALENQSLDLPSELQKRCIQSFKSDPKYSVRAFFRNDLYAFFSDMFEVVKKDIILQNDQLTSIDILIQGSKNKVAVLAKKKSCYFFNRPDIQLGRARYETYVLEKLNWKVVEVSEIFWHDQKYQQKIVQQIQQQLQ